MGGNLRFQGQDLKKSRAHLVLKSCAHQVYWRRPGLDLTRVIPAKAGIQNISKSVKSLTL